VSVPVGVVLAVLLFGIIVGISTKRLTPFEVIMVMSFGLLLGGTAGFGGHLNQWVDLLASTVQGYR